MSHINFTPFLGKALFLIITFVSTNLRAQDQVYGFTQTGGAYDMGVPYQISIDGTDYLPYGNLDGNNGGNPGNSAGFTQIVFQDQARNILSGLTVNGYQNLNRGNRIDIEMGKAGLLTPFMFTLSENSTGVNPTGKFLLAMDGQLYGMTSNKGTFNGGALFRKAAMAGSNPNVSVSFDGVNKGRSPKGNLIQGPNGLIYGMTEYGGANDMGVIFSYDLIRKTFQKILDFDGINHGANPTGSLILASNGKLYGLTSKGGVSNHGVLFEINSDGTGFKKLYDFNVTAGITPLGSLTEHTNGNLYGMTSGGGDDNFGTIFSYVISTNTLTKLVDFNGNNGKSPVGDLLLSKDGLTMYGVTFSGGDHNLGVFFRFEANGQLTPLYSFDNATGANPVGSLVMEKELPPMNFEDLPQKLTTDAPFEPTIEVPAGLKVFLSSSNSNVAIIENNKIKIVGNSGGTQITAYVVGNHQYLPRFITKQFNVNRVDQTIDFPPISSKTYGDGPFSLTATSSSGLPVQITATSNNVISSNGDQFFIKNAGTVNIKAIQPGNSTYNPAEITRELVVNKADQSITFSNPGSKICCGTFTLNASSSSGIDVDFKVEPWNKLNLWYNVASITGLGEVTITAYNNGSSNYNPAQTTQTINLIKGTQSINFIIPNTSYQFEEGGSSHFISVSSSSGLPITFTSDPPGIAEVVGSTLNILGVGTTTITATQNGNEVMSAASPISRTITVEPPAVAATNNVITFGPLDIRFVNDPLFNLSGTASSGLPVSYISSNSNVAEVNGNQVIVKGHGFTTITAIQEGNNNIPAALPVAQILEVRKKSQSVPLESSYYLTYGDFPIQLPSITSGGLPIVYSTSSSSTAYVDENYLLHIVGAGSIVLTASQPGNEEYLPVSDKYASITIKSLFQKIEFDELPQKTFGDDPFELTATSSSGLPITFTSDNPKVATINGTMITIVGAGTATVTAMQNGQPGYNNASKSHTLVVNKATPTLTFDPIPEMNISDYSFMLSAASEIDLPIFFSSQSPSIASVSGNKVSIIAAGTVTITAFMEGDDNYQPVAVDQKLKINGGPQAFELLGMTRYGGPNSSGVIFNMNSDGSNLTPLKSFSPRNSPSPKGGFTKGDDGYLYRNFTSGGAKNLGTIARFDADGSNMTIIYNFQDAGQPYGDILYGTDGFLYGITRTGGISNQGTLFKVKTDGSSFTVLHEFVLSDGYESYGSVMEASNGKLYGMRRSGSFYGYGTIFSIDKDGKNFELIFRFNDASPFKTGTSPRGDLKEGPDGYLYGTLATGGDYAKGVLFKIQPDGSNFIKIIAFDGANTGSTPGASILFGTDEKIYGMTRLGGANDQGCIYSVDADGTNFKRLFDFDGTNSGGNSFSNLLEGQDGLLYGTASMGGANSVGTLFRIKKDGSGFQKLHDFDSNAAYPTDGPLLEVATGVFIGMTIQGGDNNNGTVFSTTANGMINVIQTFPEGEYYPVQLVPDKNEEFFYGFLRNHISSIFRITKMGEYQKILDIPADVSLEQLFYVSTGHLWFIGRKGGIPAIFRLQTDGAGLELLEEISNAIPANRNIQYITERPDGTIWGVMTRGTVSQPGMIFVANNDGTGFESKGYMPSGVEFVGNPFLPASDGYIYAISGYTHTLYRYGDGESAPMKEIAELPSAIGQVPMKLIELIGGGIGVAMRGGQVFSVDKDGTHYSKILDQTIDLGSLPTDMLQTFDGWLYISASEGGANGRGVIYKILMDGSSYTPLRNFDGNDGDTPANIFFKKVNQILTFNPIPIKKASDAAFIPDAYSSSGAKIVFNSSNQDVAVIRDGKVELIGVGSSIITASAPANANFTASNTIQRELIVVPDDITTGIDPTSELRVKIFPNPVRDYVQVQLSGPQSKYTVSVFDVLGRKVFSKETNDKIVSVNFRDYEIGLYILKIEFQNEYINQRIIKSF